MKYIFAIIAGIIVGLMSHQGNGYILGGIIGYIWVYILDLNRKINELEKIVDKKQQRIKDSDFLANNPEIEPTKKYPDIETDTITATDNVVETPVVVQQALQKDSEKNTTAKVTDNHEDASPVMLTQAETNEDDQSTISQSQDSDRDLIKKMSPEHYNEEKQSDHTIPFSEILNPKTSTKSKAAVINTEPSAIELGFNKVKSWVVGYFTGGNLMVRTGMLLLFIGVAFLLKYVAERTVVPVEYRYIGVSLASFIMLVLGWKLRKKRPGFALSLEGGGIGILYLTLFAAMRIHQLLPPHVVLILLVSIVLFSAILAVVENSMALAIIGMIGGFAAPILTSTGSGSHVQLFSYYLLLNCGVFAIAWFKSWRLLNVLGFIATFGIGTLWGYKYYKPEFFLSVEPFLIGYFLLYTIIAVLFAIKQPPKLKGIMDGTIIFGTPLVGFSLQAALLKDSEYGLAYSALALGVFYVVLAFLVKLMKKPYMKDLIESFVALGIGFATLAIPLGFDGRVTSAMWVAEGSALIWVGIRQSRLFPRFSGYALTALGAAAFFVDPRTTFETLPWINADFIGSLIIVSATAFISLYSRKHVTRLFDWESKMIPQGMMFVSVVWWVFAGINEIKVHYEVTEFLYLQIFLALTVFALMFVANKIKFDLIKILSIGTALMMLAVIDTSLPNMDRQNTVFLNIRFVGFIIMALVHLYLSWYWASQKRHKLPELYSYFSYVFLFLGLINWLLTFVLEITLYYPIPKFLLVEMMMALTALVMMLLGIRLKLFSYKLSSTIVVLLMLLSFILVPRVNLELPMFANIRFLGFVTYCLTHFITAWYWQRANKPVDESNNSLLMMISNIVLSIALVSWVAFGYMELQSYLLGMSFVNSGLVFISLSVVVWVLLAHKLNWKSLHMVKYAYSLYLAYMCLAIFVDGYKFHQSYGLLVWALALLVNYWLLRIYDKKMQYSHIYHLLSLLLFSFVAVFELHQFSQHLFGAGSIWLNGTVTVGFLIISTALYLLKNTQIWPFKDQKTTYFNHGLLVLLTATFISVLHNHFTPPGSLSFVPYLPLLNILDLSGFAFVLLVYQVFKSQIIAVFDESKRTVYTLLALTAFIVLNASMLRCFHFWYAIEYKWSVMFKTLMIQSGFSILWSLTAVILMVLAAKKHIRTMWLVGLGLMVVVVAKLFLIDMSASGTVERIIAFLSVGVLLSLVGYFSPLPPDIEKIDRKGTDKVEVEQQS